MRGYQEIPGVSIDSHEIGVAAADSAVSSTLHDCEDDDLLLGSGESSCKSSSAALSLFSSLPSSWWWRSMSSSLSSFSRSLLNKNFACMAFGMLIGYIISKSLLPLRLDKFQEKSSSILVHPSIAQKYYLVNGKSFLDSLPFEDIFPTNDIQQHAQELQLPTTSASSSLATKLYEMNILSPSIISSSIVAAPPSSSTSSNTPHLLYHASLSSFGLLYDPSQASNNYISEYALDYFLINSGGFDAQINQAYCGPATVATMLNSLKYARRFRESNNNNNDGGGGGFINGGWSFDLPVDPKYTPYPYATQQDVLSGECVRNTVVMNDNNDNSNNPEDNGIFRPPYGLNLEQSSKLLACHTTKSSSYSNSDEWSISIQHVDPLSLTLSRMRYELKSALIDPYARVMINYDRKGLGQVGGGHFSPLGAYHEKTDSFLIMDVAKYKYPPVWVGAATLYGAMATPDKCGSWDYPYGQERLVGLASNNNSTTTNMNNNNDKGDGDAQRNGSTMEENHLFNPITQEDYESSLKALNCKERMRGYIILKKKVN